MNKNMGGIDRGLRTVVGIGLIAWGIVAQNWWGAIGIIPLFTASVGWCPAYLPFGLSTCKTKK